MKSEKEKDFYNFSGKLKTKNKNKKKCINLVIKQKLVKSVGNQIQKSIVF